MIQKQATQYHWLLNNLPEDELGVCMVINMSRGQNAFEFAKFAPLIDHTARIVGQCWQTTFKTFKIALHNSQVLFLPFLLVVILNVPNYGLLSGMSWIAFVQSFRSLPEIGCYSGFTTKRTDEILAGSDLIKLSAIFLALKLVP